MSERYNPRAENGAEIQEPTSSEQQEKLSAIENRAEQAKAENQGHEQQAREEVTKHSESKDLSQKAVESSEKDEGTHYSHVWHIKDLKAQAFNQTMARTRRHLSRSERKLSKFVHRPNVERISDMGAKTVARPSGILVGGAISLVGTLAVVYISKTLGTPIPKTMFLALFIAGFVVGLFIELIVKAFRIRSRKL